MWLSEWVIIGYNWWNCKYIISLQQEIEVHLMTYINLPLSKYVYKYGSIWNLGDPPTSIEMFFFVGIRSRETSNVAHGRCSFWKLVVSNLSGSNYLPNYGNLSPNRSELLNNFIAEQHQSWIMLRNLLASRSFSNFWKAKRNLIPYLLYEIWQMERGLGWKIVILVVMWGHVTDVVTSF